MTAPQPLCSITMEPFFTLPPVDGVQELVRQLASRLGHLESKRPKLDPGVELLEYQLDAGCAEIFSNLLNQYRNAHVPEIQHALQTRTGKVIPKKKSDEKRLLPKVLVLHTGRLTVPPNHSAILILLQPPADAGQELIVDAAVGGSEMQHFKVSKWQLGSSVVLFERSGIRVEPAGPGISFVNILVPVELSDRV
ncbi:hypothetical protein BCR34DRAFT_90002 [Clohesyomyces aquaticus]|uniref:Uncharacterized protein n=1 Tax=Clohesyomyces aquaticus TaxID=1231657 RepID=A0A1Y1YV28_9PLEO|nr:hypothetical protein BCR34DRAFT_90002 [Clohesyomyces aquaticus]